MSNNSSNTYIIKNKSIASLNEVYKLIIRGGEDTETTVKEKYYSIEWANVLEKQNELSADNVDGIIMVLCTCITFLGEYKFYWKLRIDS